MVKKKKVKNKKKSRQTSAPSRTLLMSIGVDIPLLRKKIPQKGPHVRRIDT